MRPIMDVNGGVIADQAAQTAREQLASYGSVIDRMQQQSNWQQQFGYQAGRDQVADSQWNQQFGYNQFLNDRDYHYQSGRDQVADGQWDQQFGYNQFLNDRDYHYQSGRDQVADSQWDQQFGHNQFMDFQNLSRQQLLDQIGREDVSYDRKMAMAQYLYESSGNASGFSALGLTPEQIAGMNSSYASQMAGTNSGGSRGGSGSGSSGKPRLTASQAMEAYQNGMDTPEVKSAVLYYFGDIFGGGQPGSGGAGAINNYKQMGPAGQGIAQQMAHLGSSDKPEYFAELIERNLKNGSITESEADFLMKSLGY